MIHDALLSLAEMLDAHVKKKTGQLSSASEMVVLTNVSDGNGIASPVPGSPDHHSGG